MKCDKCGIEAGFVNGCVDSYEFEGEGLTFLCNDCFDETIQEMRENTESNVSDINYKQLLKRYMSKVIDREGVTLADSWSGDIELTKEELEQLKLIEGEIRGEHDQRNTTKRS